MEYKPVAHASQADGQEEWRFDFTRHGLKCFVNVTVTSNGNWNWQTLIDSRGASLKAPPPLTEAERLSTALYRSGPRYLPSDFGTGGGGLSHSLPETLEKALEQIDHLYAEAEKN
jgi:hypothetical protein